MVRTDQEVGISYDRFSFLFNKKLGNERPFPSCVVDWGTEAHDNNTAQKVLGSFNDYNEIVGKLEWHIRVIGQKLILEKITDLTIDNNIQ